jgi:hypothetical protein
MEVKVWKEIQVVTDWGYETFFVCPYCASLVLDKELHTHGWHNFVAKLGALLGK